MATDTLPGMPEDVRYSDVEEAGNKVSKLTEQRLSTHAKEKEARAKLIELMESHGIETYRYDGTEIRIVEQDIKVSVKTIKDTE